MFDNISSLGYGIIVFAILIGVGSVVLYEFGGSVGCESAGFPTWNSSAGQCQNTTGGQQAPSSAAHTNTDYLLTQLGSGGLSGWVPAIIARSIGLLFLAAFFLGQPKGQGGRY